MTKSVARLDSVAGIVMGQAPTGDSYNLEGRGWPLVAGAGDFSGDGLSPKKYTSNPTKISSPGDIFISIRASIGARVLSDSEYCIGRGVASIRAKTAVLDQRYLWHWLDVARHPLSAKGRGATFMQVSKADIAELEIPLPPIAEQRRIAAILDQADELRTKRRRALELLGELADSLFIDMFGDPTVEKNRHPWMRVDEVATTRLGKMLDAKQQTGKHLRPYLRNANVHWMRFELDSMEKMDFPPDKRHEYRLKPGDILMCEGGRPGRSAIWAGEIEECYFQKALHRIRTLESLMLPEVFVWTMKFMSDGGALDDYVTSATIAHLTGEKLKSLELPVPSMALQQVFVRKALAVQEEQMAMRASLLAADELFTSIQHRAFRGEL
jgi:type I restriction enzyme S subunit